MRTCRPTRTQRGFSLAELMVVLSAGTIILTMSATLIHRIMHTQSRAYAFLDVERSAVRLSAQFRRDVHSATDALIRGAEDAVLTLQLAGDQTVEYRLEGGNVGARVLSHSGRAVSREQFPFPPETEWVLTEGAEPRRLVLAADVDAQSDLAPDGMRPTGRWAMPVSLRVEAYLGRGGRVSRIALSEERSE